MNLEDCSDTSFCSNDIPSPVVEFCFVSGDFKEDGMSSNGGTAPSRLSEALSMVALKVDNTFLMSYIHNIFKKKMNKKNFHFVTCHQ